MTKIQSIAIFLLAALCIHSATLSAHAPTRYELHTGWQCRPASEVTATGEALSLPSADLSGWKPAVVPGTVLTTLLANGEIPDPFYGMNNEAIPDIYDTGAAHYTYWFATNFREAIPPAGGQVWLTMRGINYRCDIYLNGSKVNTEPCEGMFLRRTFNITRLIARNGVNRLAVIVHPVNPVGKPNGGQGGDGQIARNVAHQYVAGWDWIRPVRDRNTGIWDKVYIETTGAVKLRHPHIVTLVPGARSAGQPQPPARLKVSAELENAGNRALSGTLSYRLNGATVSQRVTLPAGATVEVVLPDHTVENPRLWWPAGCGEQHLYRMQMQFTADAARRPSDSLSIPFGIREIHAEWNAHTRSREIHVNGRRLFIKGGNWIVSDAMLRLSPERYDAEVRYHRDMNLNLIRVWGGALTERPEFYDACDRYGLLVMQDFWFSGDCNGRWTDPLKTDDQWTRRAYPDDHNLAVASAADAIRMIRNHPSLAAWCGGNEITPPDDILSRLRDDLIPRLDGTRWFAEYSNSDDWSYNFIGGNGDGPYTIQRPETFWDHRTWPFNSEVGSVGVGDYESLVRFLPPGNRTPPRYSPNAPFGEEVDSVWTYHNYTGVGYADFIEPYGSPAGLHDFAQKAQLVNYDQYRALAEGFSAHLWDWYTGFIVWKTQNPWTSMRGQMYDCYLDPNACLFGLRKGNEPLHIMCHPTTNVIHIVNHTPHDLRNLMIVARAYDMEGRDTLLVQELAYIGASTARKYISIKRGVDHLRRTDGGTFLHLQLLNADRTIRSDNFYWYPDIEGQHTGLRRLRRAPLEVRTSSDRPGRITVQLTNPAGSPVSFFNRLSLIDSSTGDRILPAFYEDNYLSIPPATTRQVTIEYTPRPGLHPEVKVEAYGE
jgi:hypothetical protein